MKPPAQARSTFMILLRSASRSFEESVLRKNLKGAESAEALAKADKGRTGDG